MKYLFAIIVLIHGGIHLLGFIKAFNFSEIQQLTQPISRMTSLVWLFTFLLFFTTAVGLLLGKSWWFYLSMVSVFISQILIVAFWQDAKFGTIANVIILVVAGLAWSDHRFEAQFLRDTRLNLDRVKTFPGKILTEADIAHLPLPVQHYMGYSGALNQPQVSNFQLKFSGQMRGKGQDWFSFESIQYNFFDSPSRHFFMRGKFFGLSMPGYHKYQDGHASMEVSFFGLFPLVKVSGPEMDIAETVTFFNDMCLFAPAALIDDRITWETKNDNEVLATFSYNQTSIKAILRFNDQGQLVDFISEDRYEVNEMKQLTFSTPVFSYDQINDRTVVSYGEGVWHYPEGPFVYGKFMLKDIIYNTEKELQ